MNKVDLPIYNGHSKVLVLESTNCFISYVKAIASPVNNYMAFVFPLVIMIIFGDSLFLDYNTSFFRFSITRISYKKYIKYKIIAISLISFLISFIFNIAAFLYSVVTSPYYFPKNIKFAPTVGTDIYLNNPYIYVFITFIIISLISMSISVLGIISANIFENIFAVVSMPWIVYLLIGFFIKNMSSSSGFLYENSPVEMMFIFLFHSHFSFMHIFLYWTIFWIVGALIGYKLSLKRFLSMGTF